ncbi:hypothetical protein NXW65_24240 [Bacteroides thetaiotaomicron]|uniref:hypothetical protein n=1 Tax=Bacteroides thetaiotaomicron TaxID=818 RepID=UPI0021660328|nr:hypothetical protein [Bacteroides thetaiotaomicron]MCS3044284.1 hypothetical protein [Bacteroides thetaiotaomicron]
MNPYYILNNYLNEYESERFYGKFQLDYEFLKYFKFTYRMGLDTTTGQSDKGNRICTLFIMKVLLMEKVRAPAVLSLVKPDNILSR